MKIYKNQNKENARQNGFHANFSFASDIIMSPNGIDMTVCDNKGVETYELTTYDKETDTVKIEVFTDKEWGTKQATLATVEKILE